MLLLSALASQSVAATTESVVDGDSPLGDTDTFATALSSVCGALVAGPGGFESSRCAVTFAEGSFEVRFNVGTLIESRIEPTALSVETTFEQDLSLLTSLGFGGFHGDFTETKVIAADTRVRGGDGAVDTYTSFVGTTAIVERSINGVLVSDHRLLVTRDAAGALLYIRGFWPDVPNTILLQVSQTLASGEGSVVAVPGEVVASEVPVLIFNDDSPDSGMIVNRVVLLPEDESYRFAKGRVFYLLDGEIIEPGGVE